MLQEVVFLPLMPAALHAGTESANQPWAQLRAQMPALANKTYFNYGGQGPLPEPSLQAIVECWQRIQQLGPFTGDAWPYLDQVSSGLRGRLAQWFGVGPHRISLTENVTSGCVLPLWGLPWQAGDELLVSDGEHPGVVAACRELARRLNLQLQVFPVIDLRGDTASAAAGALAALERGLSPRTRMVVLSHVLWNTGQVMPIAAAAERLQAEPCPPWLLVDAAQCLGNLAVQEAAAAADIYACTGHNWSCGPEGLGAMVLSERLLEQASPTLIGWRSLREETSAGSSFHRDGRRFEVATSCLPLQAGLDRSLQLLEGCGDAQVRSARIQALGSRLWHGLRELKSVSPLLESPPTAGLVSFSIEGSAPEAVVGRLGAQAIWLRTLANPHCLRACTHITTTEAEVDRLLEALCP